STSSATSTTRTSCASSASAESASPGCMLGRADSPVRPSARPSPTMTRLPRSLLHVLLGGATCVASACDPCSGVAARIEALAAGETYAVPEGCVVREALTIPAGARVEGAQIELEPGESIALSPSPDAARPTVLAGATVRVGNDDAPAVVARGPGRIAI